MIVVLPVLKEQTNYINASVNYNRDSPCDCKYSYFYCNLSYSYVTAIPNFSTVRLTQTCAYNTMGVMYVDLQ